MGSRICRQAGAAAFADRPRGARRIDDRRVISGIIHMLRTGARWRGCPPTYGPYTTIYNRLNRWSRQGVWHEVFRALTGESGVFGTAAIDATHVKRWMQDLVIETAHASLFAALFVTHDLIEATRIAQRIIVLDVNGDGVAGERLLAGDPDSRGDREIFETVHGFLHDAPIFRHIYDVDERKLA